MYKLILHGVQIPIYLGVYDFEQLEQQNIVVDVEINYYQEPKGCQSDQHQDIICYVRLNELLLKAASKKSYQLIEHVAQIFVQELMEQIDFPADVKVTVFKKPPLDNVKMASFTVEHKWHK